MLWLNLIVALAGLGVAVLVLSKANSLKNDIEFLESSINSVNDKLKTLRGKHRARLVEMEYEVFKRTGRLKVDVPFTIIDDCIACGSCKAACPIPGVITEGEIYEIDMRTCEACAKCAEVCPTNSCVPVVGELEAFMAAKAAAAPATNAA